jgi:hypothetical protein
MGKRGWSQITACLLGMQTSISWGTNYDHEPNYIHVQDNKHFCKMKVKLISDLINSIPLMTNTDPEKILNVLICEKEIHNFGLVSGNYFVTAVGVYRYHVCFTKMCDAGLLMAWMSKL